MRVDKCTFFMTITTDEFDYYNLTIGPEGPGHSTKLDITLTAMHLVLTFSRLDLCVVLWQQNVNHSLIHRLILQREAPKCTQPVEIGRFFESLLALGVVSNKFRKYEP